MRRKGSRDRGIRGDNEFKQAKDAIEGLRVAQYWENKLANHVSSDDLDAKDFIRDEKNIQRQWALVMQILPDLRCPMCRRIKLKRRQWVLFSVDKLQGLESMEGVSKMLTSQQDGMSVVCRSCAQRNLQGVLWAKVCEVRFEVYGPKLKEARKAAGVSIRAMAKTCGWHHSYQYALERKAISNVSEATAKAIATVLKIGEVAKKIEPIK